MARALVALPARAPVVLFWAALVTCVTILLGAFRPVVVLPVLAVVLVATWRGAPEPVEVTRRSVAGAGAALGLALTWLVLNLPWASEVLLVQRDPGFLTLEGLWLRENADASIPLRSATSVAAAVPGVDVVSDAFWQVGSVMDAQGAKTFPGLIAMAGWVGGQSWVLAGNLIIGAIALLAAYDLGRRLLDPIWALLPMAALALSVPWLYFTRTPFTEPTNVALTLGGLAVLWSLPRQPQAWRFALGGAMLGATALSRIDGAAVTAGLVLGVGLAASAARAPATRVAWVRGMWWAGGAACAMVVLGFLDLRLNSPGYLDEHAGLYKPLIGLLIGSCLAAAVLERITRSGALAAWVGAHAGRIGSTGALGVGLAAVVLVSRPLWMQAHGWAPGSPIAQFVEAFQSFAGVPVDGTRSYDEMTMRWLSWYLGPLTVLLGVVGVALMFRESVVRRRPELLVVLLVLGVPALIYLVRPTITPDQVWATRRLLTAAIPLVLLGAAWLLRRAAQAAPGRLRLRPWLRFAVAVAGLAILLGVRGAWAPVLESVDFGGRAQEVAAMCQHIDGDPVVFVRVPGPTILPTVRIVCDADVVELVEAPDAARLAALRKAWGVDRVVVAAFSATVLPWAGVAPAATLTTPMSRWPHGLYPPQEAIPFTSQLWMGTIDDDGQVEPVPDSG